MTPFLVELVMRYTRISCSPFRARFPAARIVQAEDELDAVRQACLCLDRDLEEILSHVNAINVDQVWVEFANVERNGQPKEKKELWNPSWFPRQVVVPPYIRVKP